MSQESVLKYRADFLNPIGHNNTNINLGVLMEEFIAYLIKNMVNIPEQVDIRSVEGQSGLLIEIRVAPEDVGKVVGRKGNIIRSLRTLAITIGARLGRRIRLEIIQ